MESYETVGFDVQVHNDCDAQVEYRQTCQSYGLHNKHVKTCSGISDEVYPNGPYGPPAPQSPTGQLIVIKS